MDASEISVFAFGIYLGVTALSFIFVPKLLLGLLRFERAEEPWIRALGLVMVVLGYYYADS